MDSACQTGKPQQKEQQDPEHRGSPDEAHGTLHQIDIGRITQTELAPIGHFAIVDHRSCQLDTQGAGAGSKDDLQIAIGPLRGLCPPTMDGILEIANDGKCRGRCPQRQPFDDTENLPGEYGKFILLCNIDHRPALSNDRSQPVKQCTTRAGQIRLKTTQ